MASLVSVVIPTYNSERHISRCIASLQAQSHGEIEVIVVDNNSTDRTASIAAEYGVTIIVEKLGMSAARNRGLTAATGEYLLSIDSDMELSPDVVHQCVDLLEARSDVEGVIIPERSVGSSFWVRVRNFERSFYADTLIASARFFRMELARAVGGFDERLTCFEDSTLPQRISALGYNVRQSIDAHILHYEEPFYLVSWLKKKSRYARSARTYFRHYTGYARRQLNPIYRYAIFLRQWRRMIKHPALSAGVFLLKTMEFAVGGVGLVMSACRRS